MLKDYDQKQKKNVYQLHLRFTLIRLTHKSTMRIVYMIHVVVIEVGIVSVCVLLFHLMQWLVIMQAPISHGEGMEIVVRQTHFEKIGTFVKYHRK